MTCHGVVVLVLGALLVPQSLGDLARKEAERRRALEEQGVAAKVIDGTNGRELAPGGNVTVSSPVPGAVRARSLDVRGAKPDTRVRGVIQKLDRQIRQAEDRLRALRLKADAERWAPPRVGRIVQRGAALPNEEKIREDIAELELKLKRLREDRIDAYNNARKAGLLPGEIDGKGITP